MSEEEPSPFQTVSETEMTRLDYYQSVWDTNVVAPFRILMSDWRGRFGLFTIVFFVFVGTIGVRFIGEPTANEGEILMGPFKSWQFPLGTGRYGKSILESLVHSTPFMLKMVTGGAVYSVSLAVLVGTFSGYSGGRVDELLMMIADTVIAVPGLPLIIVIAQLISPENPYFVGVIIALPRWAGLSRSLRSEVLSVREESYIEASTAMGLSTWTIMRKEIIPNLMPYITINFVGAARGVIFASVGLYFLGLLPISGNNWGVMMQRAYSSSGALYTWDTAHYLIFPMLTIIWFTYGLIMFGQSADKLFNPRLRARHAKTIEDEGAPAEAPE